MCLLISILWTSSVHNELQFTFELTHEAPVSVVYDICRNLTELNKSYPFFNMAVGHLSFHTVYKWLIAEDSSRYTISKANRSDNRECKSSGQSSDLYHLEAFFNSKQPLVRWSTKSTYCHFTNSDVCGNIKYFYSTAEAHSHTRVRPGPCFLGVMLQNASTTTGTTL